MQTQHILTMGLDFFREEGMRPHRPMVSIVLCFGTGIIGHLFWHPSIYALVFFFGICFLISIFLFNKRYVAFFIWMTLVSSGMLYASSYDFRGSNHIDQLIRMYQGKMVTLKGVVISDVRKNKSGRGERTNFSLKIEGIQCVDGWEKASGKILVNVFKEFKVAYGDIIVIEGKLHEPFQFAHEERSSYKDYLRNQGIRSVLSVRKNAAIEIVGHGSGNPLQARAFGLREKFKRVLSYDLTSHEAALMNAFLLGDRSDIPGAIKDLFVQTGTVHIIAISGMNVGIVAFILLIFLKMVPIGRAGQLVATILLLIGYAFLTGLSPSVVRATIMINVFLMSFLWEKQSDSLNTLSLAAFLILLMNPFNLFDVGFQLSFICVLAIILFFMRLKQGIITQWPWMERQPFKFLVESLSVSIAVWFAVLGLIAYYFNIVTPITVIANLAVIPLSTALVVLGFGQLLTGGWPFLGHLFAVCIKIVLNFLVGSVYVFAQCPGAYFYWRDVTFWHMIVYYVLLGIIMGACYMRNVRART